MGTKVSYIVAVYNVGEYIERCARSLFEQSLEDLEIVFVNDASTDNSEFIIRKTLEDYPHRKGQVKILTHKTNKGIRDTRKDGFYAATGDYFYFVDGDDYVESQMAEQMYAKAAETGADVVVCDFVRHLEFCECVETQAPNGVVGNGENVRDDTINRRVTGTIWCKLIRRSLFMENDIVWPAGPCHDDMVLSTMAVYYAKKIAYVSEPLYHYRYNPNSISNHINAERGAKRLRLYADNGTVLYEFLKREGVEDKYSEGILFNKIGAKNQVLPFTGAKKYRKLWLHTYPELNKLLLFGSKKLRSTYREKIWFMAIWLGLFPKLKRRLMSKRFRPANIWCGL